jgi:hypothetical protein
VTRRRKNTPPLDPAASTGHEGAFLKRIRDFNAGKITTFDESLANYDAMSIDELWRQSGKAVCALDRCEGLLRLEQADNDPEDPAFLALVLRHRDAIAELKKRITRELLRRGIGQQAIDEHCAKALSEKKEADLLTASPASGKMPSTRAKRGPDKKMHSDRVEFEDGLRRELKAINQWIEKESVSTVNELRERFAEFKLWTILTANEQEDLLKEPFKPRTYARTLTARNFGIGEEAIKKSRQK